jgi:hypothetical protein
VPPSQLSRVLRRFHAMRAASAASKPRSLALITTPPTLKRLLRNLPACRSILDPFRRIDIGHARCRGTGTRGLLQAGCTPQWSPLLLSATRTPSHPAPPLLGSTLNERMVLGSSYRGINRAGGWSVPLFKERQSPARLGPPEPCHVRVSPAPKWP